MDVIETRHGFAEVRNADGVEGWSEISLLLSAQQMDDLNRLAASAASLPSEGSATVYEALNIHAAPNRESPSFFKIPENGVVEVIGHRVAPRIVPEPVVHHPIVRKAPKRAKGKSAKQTLTPPMPLPPPLPRNWIAMSEQRSAPAEATPPGAASQTSASRGLGPGPNKGRQGGLGAGSGMLSMMIPDEVAAVCGRASHHVVCRARPGEGSEGFSIEE